MKKIITIFILISTVLFTNGCQGDTNSNLTTDAKTESNDHALGTNSLQEENKSQKVEIKQNNSVNGELKVHYIDVGQADSTLLHFTDNGKDYAMLIDAGDFTGDEVVPYLHQQGIKKIHIAIGTHPDADHIGQLENVIRSFPVEEVWLSGNMSYSDTFMSVLAAIDEKNVTYIEPRTGDTYELGPMTIKVLHPKEITGQANDESISVKITYGEISFIFTGDSSKESEWQMLRTGYDVQADILQLGHHGSSTSTDESFLKAVQPKIAIYSAGKDNSYGHPSKEVVQLINKYQIPLYGTDVHGNIIVTTDGHEFSIVTEKNGVILADKETKKTTPQTKNNIGCVNINNAPKDEIEKIVHIGPERADEVMKLRPYNSVEELKRVNGIGSARLKDIIDEGLACVGG